MAGDLVDTLTEFRIGIGRETGTDALVRGREGLAAILAQVVAARGDAEVKAIPVAKDRVHAQPSVAGLPLSSVLMVADARNQLPGISAVARPEERCWLHATQEILLVIPRFERPDVGESRPSSFENAGADLVSLNFLPKSVERRTFMPKKGLQLEA